MKTKRQKTKKGRPNQPAQVPADDSLFRRDLKRLEKNNRKFFGGKVKGDANG